MTTTTPTRQRRQADSLTLPQFCRRYGIGHDKARSWLRNGTIRAVNVASNPDAGPRWVIPPEALRAFEASRSSTPTVTPEKPQRRRRKSNDVIEFFK